MAKDEDEQESRGFKVQDRRRFVDAEPGSDRDAESRASEESHAAETSPPSAAGASSAGSEAARGAAGDFAADTGGAAAFGEMSFSSFVMGLTTQALMHLGEIPDPMNQNVAHDLPAAKQMIDLLGILRDKTKGNLDAAEEQLLGEVLYDLRMRYVEMARNR
jgi:hypothetical protein